MTEVDKCAACGKPVPEGRQICPECENAQSVHVVVYGKPFGKERPRVVGRVAYTPERTRTEERAIAWAYRAQAGTKRFTVPAIEIRAYFRPPGSATKTMRQAMLAGEIRPKIKPDWDNIGKLICDALNGIAYEDDKDIVEAKVVKAYSERERTEIIIRETGKSKGDEKK